MISIMNLTNRNKGLTIIEGAIVLLMAILVYIMATKGWNELSYRYKKYQLTNQISEINAGAEAWRGNRSNFSGVTMTKLCASGQQSVSEQTCGGVGGSGTSSNSFGGNFTIAANTGNLSQKNIAVTGLPAERINELADSFAALTVNQCASAEDCDSLSVSGTTITLTM